MHENGKAVHRHRNLDRFLSELCLDLRSFVISQRTRRLADIGGSVNERRDSGSGSASGYLHCRSWKLRHVVFSPALPENHHGIGALYGDGLLVARTFRSFQVRPPLWRKRIIPHLFADLLSFRAEDPCDIVSNTLGFLDGVEIEIPADRVRSIDHALKAGSDGGGVIVLLYRYRLYPFHVPDSPVSNRLWILGNGINDSRRAGQSLDIGGKIGLRQDVFL